MEIPYKDLKPETLKAIVSEFVLREGTDYGSQDITLESKIDQVVKSIKSRRAVVAFDPETESCTVLPAG